MLEAALSELNEAFGPSFRKQLREGASEAELGALRAVVDPLPDEVAAWFRWHAGSGDGAVPGTSWGLITVDEAVREVTHARSANEPPQLVAQTFVPLLTGRDGRLMVFVASESGPAVWELDRGERVRTSTFDEWLKWLVGTWRSEESILRAAWLRVERSPMGWHELHLPSRIRSKLKASVLKLPAIVQDGARTVSIELGAEPGYTLHDVGPRKLDVVLTGDGAKTFASALADKSRDSLGVPGIENLRVVFGDR